ncbi:MAG TPA: methionine adenosyltransferase [Stellaceae bacterium]|nr:methionine adenosyltransferase [Stellaceae bacterium]
MHVAVSRLERATGDGLDLEIVERKGVGHPDTICDEIAEEFSLALSRHYLAETGEILHHNVDKVLLAAGTSKPAFGGGEVTAPMRLFLAGRATTSAAGKEVPVGELARQAASGWLRRHLPTADLERHLELSTLVHPSSADLTELFARRPGKRTRLANDTSCGVGYAPLSRLETIVHAAERELGAAATCGRPAIGRDIKVMGVRQGGHFHLTVACALVGRFVKDADEYLEAKHDIAGIVREAAAAQAAGSVAVDVNAADDPAKRSFYLTVTGTSAEAGDDGQAGRGNRANGLITPCRPMTMESVAGKNPMTHVGKLYNIAAGLTAQVIVDTLPEIAAAEVRLVSRIGRPIAEPATIAIRVAPQNGRPPGAFAKDIEAIVTDHLGLIETLWRELLTGDVRFGRWPLRSHAPPGRSDTSPGPSDWKA